MVLMSSMKPMSSMRSASSSTSICDVFEHGLAGLQVVEQAAWGRDQDVQRAAQRGLDLRRVRHAADDRRDAQTLHVAAVGVGRLGDLDRQFTRRGTARARAGRRPRPFRGFLLLSLREARMPCSAGMTKAAVLPLPVLAETIRSACLRGPAEWPGFALRSCTRCIAMLKSRLGPAQRAEYKPGEPPSACTQNPLSSASAGRSDATAAASAFSAALPAKLSAVSSGSSSPSRAALTSSTPDPASNCSNSTSFPALWLASTRRSPRARLRFMWQASRAPGPPPRAGLRTASRCRGGRAASGRRTARR